MKLLFILIILVLVSCSNSTEKETKSIEKEISSTEIDYGEDGKQILALAKKIEESISNNDPIKLSEAFAHETALVWGTYQGVSDKVFNSDSFTAKGLISFIGNSSQKVTQVFDEVKITHVSEGMGIMHTTYRVKINDKPSHQGEEVYSLIKTNFGWKVISISFSMKVYK